MSVEESADFDPYYKWLGIPASEQPPNHYRLLGIELFEEDPDVITAAADRQMGHVKAFATGPYGAHSQLLLNELSKARVCLLNPKLKPIYDKQLAKLRSEKLKAIAAAKAQAERANQRQSSSTPQPTPQRVAHSKPSDSTMALEMLATTHASPVSRKSRKKKSPVLTYGITLLISGALLAGLLYYAKINAPPPVEQTAQNDEPVDSVTEPDPDPAPVELETLDSEPPQPDPPVDRPDVTDSDGQPPVQRNPLPNQEENTRQPIDPPNRDRVAPPARVAEPFESLPANIQLASQNGKDSPIGEFAAPLADLGELDLHISSPSYFDRVNRTIVMVRDQETDEQVTWLVYDEPTPKAREIAAGDTDSATPVVEFRATKKELSYSVLPNTEIENPTERLQQCVLRLSMDEHLHDMQLRAPVEDSDPIVLGDWREVYEHQIPIDSIPNLPPVGELKLRFVLTHGFPATNVVNGQPDRLGAEEQVALSFVGANYAGIGAFWETKGKLLSIRISPGFRLLSSSDDLHVLSASEVEKVAKRLVKENRETTKEYEQRVKGRAVLNRNLAAANSLDIRLPGGGTTVARRNQKNAAIAAARAEINANAARITELQKLSSQLSQDEQIRLPKLRKLAADLDGRARVAFALYLPVGSQEVVLYSKGMPPGEIQRSSSVAAAEAGASNILQQWLDSPSRYLEFKSGRGGSILSVDDLAIRDMSDGREIFQSSFDSSRALDSFLLQFNSNVQDTRSRWIDAPPENARLQTEALLIASREPITGLNRNSTAGVRATLRQSLPGEFELRAMLTSHDHYGRMYVQLVEDLPSTGPPFLIVDITNNRIGRVALRAQGGFKYFSSSQRTIQTSIPFEFALRITRNGVAVSIDGQPVVNAPYSSVLR